MDALELNPARSNCQRWSSGRHSFVRRSDGGFDADRYHVEAVDEATAKSYVTAHHYSHSYPSASYRYGLYLDGQDDGGLVGVAVFGTPVNTASLSNAFPSLEPLVESFELSRFVLESPAAPASALRAPANSESWFLARCFEQLAHAGVRGILSFSDPVPRVIGGQVVFPGHWGCIYQASNAVWAGRSSARTLRLLPDGTTLNDRSLQKVRSQDRGHEHVERKLMAFGARAPQAGQNPRLWLAEALDEVHATRLRHRGCLRYLFPIGTRRQRSGVELGFSAQHPYPKRVDAAA